MCKTGVRGAALITTHLGGDGKNNSWYENFEWTWNNTGYKQPQFAILNSLPGALTRIMRVINV